MNKFDENNFPFLDCFKNNNLTNQIYEMLQNSGYDKEGILSISESFDFFVNKNHSIIYIPQNIHEKLLDTNKFVKLKHKLKNSSEITGLLLLPEVIIPDFDNVPDYVDIDSNDYPINAILFSWLSYNNHDKISNKSQLENLERRIKSREKPPQGADWNSLMKTLKENDIWDKETNKNRSLLIIPVSFDRITQATNQYELTSNNEIYGWEYSESEGRAWYGKIHDYVMSFLIYKTELESDKINQNGNSIKIFKINIPLLSLKPEHKIIFDKLHKFNFKETDIDFYKTNGIDETTAIEYAKSAAALKILDEFQTKIECKSIGFEKKSDMQKIFHQWIKEKNWKGLNKISNTRSLFRKYKEFSELNQHDREKALSLFFERKKGNKNSQKFTDKHLALLQKYLDNENVKGFFKQFNNDCENEHLEKVSYGTVTNYFKTEKDKYIEQSKVTSIDNLHSKYLELSDFDFYYSLSNIDNETASQLMNSAAALSLVSSKTLKYEIKQIKYKTKGQFLDEFLNWLQTKNWTGLNKISNVSVLKRKSSEFKNTLGQSREKALEILTNRKKGNKNSQKFRNEHLSVLSKIVENKTFSSKIDYYRKFVKECKKEQIEIVSEQCFISYLNLNEKFKTKQKYLRQYKTPKTLKLTDEQLEILKYDDNLKINAVAGSGKTTTLIEYAKTRNPKSKILYLAFNKSVKNEAQRKFKSFKLNNVEILTAHSLAYRNVIENHKFSDLQAELNPFEIINVLKIERKDKKDSLILSSHIKKFFEYFCNNSIKKLNDLNYLDIIYDNDARNFVKSNLDDIYKYTDLLFQKMDNKEIKFTHDYYLKKFQLKSPNLDYDYIFFDEGQDASPVMLDVFMKQSAKKIIVGDTNQQIYAWRYAINSLDRVEFKSFNLTQSFRFDNDIASLAIKIISLKHLINGNYKTKIFGIGNAKQLKSKATLARTNYKLLEIAINQIFEEKTVKSVYFEGHISSYKYATRNSILFDVLMLYYNKTEKIRDELIKEMNNFKELIKYAKRTEDNELSMIIKLVMTYKGKLPKLIEQIKEIHVSNSQKHNADMIYSTVHKCKGMEYDEVIIADDFITQDEMNKILINNKQYIRNKINEEINLLYVAVTRTKNKIHIPEKLIPTNGSINRITN